jgi:hypothetical protein
MQVSEEGHSNKTVAIYNRRQSVVAALVYPCVFEIRHPIEQQAGLERLIRKEVKILRLAMA